MAIQFIPLIAAIVGGTATIGAGTYAYKSYQDAQEQQRIAPLTIETSPAAKTAPTPELVPQIVAVAPKPPEFHLLRVEEDGSIVIAGSAQPKSNVEILHAEQTLAQSKAGSNGDFAIIFDTPLKPGTYELFIRSTLEDTVLLSAEAGIVQIPENGQEVIAMVSKPGAATKLIQVPAAPLVTETPPIVPSPTQIIGEVAPVAIAPVLLGAVEVEDGKLFIAGSGEPGRMVNLYVDDNFIGSAKVTVQGTYLLEANSILEIGNHIVRADMLEINNVIVSARAQVPLVHEGPPVEVVAVPVPTKPIIVAAAPVPKVEVPVTRSITSAKIIEPKRVIRTGTSVIIRSGDNLWRVSRRILGRGIRYSTIYNANKSQIKNPDLIFPGQIFKVPEKMAGNDLAQEG